MPVFAKAGRERGTLRGHTNFVSAAAFSPDGSTIASGSEDLTIKFWDVRTCRGRATLSGSTDPVWALAYSPDGTMLASGGGTLDEPGRKGEVKLWDLAPAAAVPATTGGHSAAKRALKSLARRLARPALASPDFDESVLRAIAPIRSEFARHVDEAIRRVMDRLPGLVAEQVEESVRRAVAAAPPAEPPPTLHTDPRYGGLIPAGPGVPKLGDLSVFADPLSSGARVNKGTQVLLSMKYQELVRAGEPLPAFGDVGFRTFSEFDEAGLLLYIFSLIGIATRTVVEVCGGVGYSCNSANWIINHGFRGLLFDGNRWRMETMWAFFVSWPDTSMEPPKQVLTWVESDTIDGLIASHGFTGEVDLLSIDLDGIDYWVLEAIRCIRPRVVVVEYQPGWLEDEPMTIPDIKGFTYSADKVAFCGASLAAFHRLLDGRGYRLVGCNANRLNAFFVRRGLADDLLPEVSVSSCLDHPRIAEFRDIYRAELLEQADWVRV